MTTRRTFLAGSLVAGLMGPVLGSAQEATPVASPVAIPPEDAERLLDLLTPTPDPTPEDEEDSEPWDLPGRIGADYVAYELADAGFETFFLGGAIEIVVAGIEFSTEKRASESLDRIIDRMLAVSEDSWSTSDEFTLQSTEITEISVGRLGDERAATMLTAQVESEFADQISMVCVTIRKERWVQMLLGYGLNGVTRPLIDIAESLDGRWPSDDLADMLPELDDMPPGMAITED